MKRITDREFVYVPSHATNIAKTFKRIAAEQKKQAAAKVVPIKARKP